VRRSSPASRPSPSGVASGQPCPRLRDSARPRTGTTGAPGRHHPTNPPANPIDTAPLLQGCRSHAPCEYAERARTRAQIICPRTSGRRAVGMAPDRRVWRPSASHRSRTDRPIPRAQGQRSHRSADTLREKGRGGPRRRVHRICRCRGCVRANVDRWFRARRPLTRGGGCVRPRPGVVERVHALRERSFWDMLLTPTRTDHHRRPVALTRQRGAAPAAGYAADQGPLARSDESNPQCCAIRSQWPSDRPPDHASLA
jgi:hypothetical protein